MGLLGRQTVIAKCPACQASTKVVAHPDKTAIRCPRCQASVPLAFARKYTGEPPPKEPERQPIQQESSRGYGAEEPLITGHTSESAAKRRQRRYTADGKAEFNYPDHTVKFTRYAILATVAGVILALISIVFFAWRESVNSRIQEYTLNISDSLKSHEEAQNLLRKAFDPLEGVEAQKNYRTAKANIEVLATRRRAMTPPDLEKLEDLKRLIDELAKADIELAKSDAEFKKLSLQLTPKKDETEQPQPSISAALGYSITSGPPPSASQKPKAEPRKPVDDKAVLITIPDISKSQWSDEFIRRFAILADNGDGKVTVNWSGDLLTLEVRPVIDPARYATRINFGRLLYYSRNDRTLTIEFKPDKITNYNAMGDLITPILIDLKQREKIPKLQAALIQLNNLKVDPVRQAEVAAVLETLAIDTKLDNTLRDMAIKLIPNWSGKESADLLIRLLDDKSSTVRLSAIDALVETHAPTAGPALIKRWEKQETERISQALITLGSDVETLVLPFLNNNNNVTLKTEACRVLKEIGTAISMKPLLDLMQTKDQTPQIVNAAKDAMKHILDRQTNK